MSYAVVWRQNHGRVYAGRLDFGDRSLELTGAALARHTNQLALPYEDLGDVWVERRRPSRLAGLPTLGVDGTSGRLRIGSLQGAGVLHELAERLQERAAAAAV